jgi:hypothetical protein
MRHLFCPGSDHCNGLENQAQDSFNPKNLFSTNLLLKTLIKHLKNHDKPIHGLKKPFKKPNSTQNQKST